MNDKQNIGKEEESQRSESDLLKKLFYKQKNREKDDLPLVPEIKTSGKPVTETAKDKTISEATKSSPTDNLFNRLGVTDYFQPYGYDRISSKSALSDEASVVLYLGNRCKKSIFELEIKGVGNLYYEKFRIKPGESQKIDLVSGSYNIIANFNTGAIIHLADIAENEEWCYKSRPGGVNEDDRLVEFKKGQYSLWSTEITSWMEKLLNAKQKLYKKYL